MLSRSKLHSYQLDAINFVKDKKKCALFLDMGLGKTATSLTVASDFLDDLFVINVLIIAPLRVANTVWKQESEKWSHLNHLKINICTGTAKERLASLKEPADIHVINRENLPWLCQNIKWRWDMVIVDESTSFKSYKSVRFKHLAKQLDKISSIILLSGTPAPNGFMDLWSQIYLIDKGDRLGRNITAYRNRFFYQERNNFFSFKLRDDSKKDLLNAIEDICITMKAKNHIDMPGRIDISRTVVLPASAEKHYKQLKKDFVLSLDGNEVIAKNVAVLGGKLLQICNGTIYDEDKNPNVLHKEKVECLKEIIEDNPSENILLAYNFRTDLTAIMENFPDAVVLSKSGVELEAWNRGEIKLLVAHPASAGHGLNAQKGGSMIVWFGLNWSLELYQQFNARLYRQGQKECVRIVHIVVDGHLDSQVMKAISLKAETQGDLINFLKYGNVNVKKLLDYV